MEVYLTQDTDQWEALVKMEINFWVPQNAMNFLTSRVIVAFQGGLCPMESVTWRFLYSDFPGKRSVECQSSVTIASK
jgi:hypothetical protein